MPTEDAYSSGHLVLSHFGACKCSNVETNIFWTCLVSGLLSFEHPSVLLFLLCTKALFYILSRFSASKLLRKALKIATKACNNKRIISSDLKPEVDASLIITLRKVMITCGIAKSYQFNFFSSLVLKLQDTETVSLKTHYIHVYKVFG